jgi:hypothetical protein
VNLPKRNPGCLEAIVMGHLVRDGDRVVVVAVWVFG